MSDLPLFIRRAPSILYGLAILFFVASFVLSVTDIQITGEHAAEGDPLIRQAKLRALYQAALEAVYIAANGVVAQILLAFFDKVRRPADHTLFQCRAMRQRVFVRRRLINAWVKCRTIVNRVDRHLKRVIDEGCLRIRSPNRDLSRAKLVLGISQPKLRRGTRPQAGGGVI